jgi:hypothetical protein
LGVGAKDVRSFLGRRWTGHFLGEMISDRKDGGWRKRIPGARIKPRVTENGLKMDDKAGLVLRMGMVINHPEAFKVRKKGIRKNKPGMEWVSRRKGVAYLFRYRDVSRRANYRYREALAVVDDPTPALKTLDDVTTRTKTPSGCGLRAFHPLAREDLQLFKAMRVGEQCIRGLSHADLRTLLESSPHLRDLSPDPRKQSAKASRIRSRFHAHKLISQIPRTRRRRVASRGKPIMAASLCLRNVAFPELFRTNIAV